MLSIDLHEVDAVAKQRGLGAADVVQELEAALVAAAQQHFGPRHVFESKLEEGMLKPTDG